MERFYKTEGYDSGSNVLRMVGYFSLVGLLRVHTLVGDYHGALKALAVVHPFQRTNLYTPKIAGVLITQHCPSNLGGVDSQQVGLCAWPAHRVVRQREFPRVVGNCMCQGLSRLGALSDFSCLAACS